MPRSRFGLFLVSKFIDLSALYSFGGSPSSFKNLYEERKWDLICLKSSIKRSTSSSDSDPLHHRSIADRSPKLGDRCSQRGAQSETLNQKKLGTRIVDLESQLGQAQEELKVLKDQLASAEATKKEAQDELVKKAVQSVVPVMEKFQEKCTSKNAPQEPNKTGTKPHEDDVLTIEFTKPQSEKETQQPFDDSTAPAMSNPCVDEMALKNDEIASLKSSLEEKGEELESMSNENEILKSQ
ncbi:hypothetical protein RJT34_14762 [Clitoria ternatea]|uniref:Uncharacterized protein n=1 Tax=Clitoria ternatea TaxID=43366 RepID=A0AAN9PLE2_CLITE